MRRAELGGRHAERARVHVLPAGHEAFVTRHLGLHLGRRSTSTRAAVCRRTALARNVVYCHVRSITCEALHCRRVSLQALGGGGAEGLLGAGVQPGNVTSVARDVAAAGGVSNVRFDTGPVIESNKQHPPVSPFSRIDTSAY